MSPPQTPTKMAISFYQVTPVGIDGSPNVVVRTVNVSTIEHVRPANAGEIAQFPTAATTFIVMEKEGLNVRKRTIVTAAVYATVNTALTAA